MFAEVLVLDDLGAQQSSPWANEKLFQLLNYRYNMGMPTVIALKALLILLVLALFVADSPRHPRTGASSTPGQRTASCSWMMRESPDRNPPR